LKTVILTSLRYLLENGFFTDVDVRNEDQDSLLNIVIARQAQDGRSPLHEAAELNDVEAASVLLSNPDGGCFVDVKDNNGLTPLHIACQMGQHASS
jgi:ankyrin repeat protein